jgi:hypothetical protein
MAARCLRGGRGWPTRKNRRRSGKSAGSLSEQSAARVEYHGSRGFFSILVFRIQRSIWVVEHALLEVAVRRAHKKMAESGRTPPFLLEHNSVRTKVIRTATASERPSVGPGRARDNEPARIPQWPPGQHEASTNDEPRHQPACPETRPNQRLCVSLGSPPSVAVGSLSARTAHRSRAPNLIPRMHSIAAQVKTSRHAASAK